MRSLFRVCASLAVLLATAVARGDDPLDRCNVTWTTPSPNSSGSMPIGNGDVGLNLWVEPSGDLVFYLSKTDAWSENCRPLKLGRVRVKLLPNPLADGAAFRQTLRLRQGEVEIVAGEGPAAVTLRVWVDANRPVVRVEAASEKEFDVEVGLELWRTEKRQLTGKEVHSAYGLHGRPEPVFCFPDTVLPGAKDRITWYHRNESSIWAENLGLQGLEGFAAKSSDPLLHRTFGGCIRGEGLAPDGPTALKSTRPASRFVVSVYPLTARTDTADEWIGRLDKSVAAVDAVALETARAEHRRWWDEFWNRSWIRVSGSPEADVVNRGYTLQRWIAACGGRGASPIKFNGSIFTVEGDGFDADYRRWGGPYWFQNTRLAYWPMLAAGDYDMMRPLFAMYLDALPLRRHATQAYYGHDGAFYPETMYFWGTYTDANYGRDRRNKPDGLTDNGYIRRYWQGGIELVMMMLDYYDHTGDAAFREETLLPLAVAVTTFFNEHWPRNAEGKIQFHPAQALETWWDATNPMPEVAGLRAILPRLVELPVDERQKAAWRDMLGDLPPVPFGEADGKRFLAAAERFASRHNSENPELYAVFPYRVYALGKPDLDVALEAWRRRAVKRTGGWSQDAIQAALLGLTAEARGFVAANFANHHRGSRFPAFWGPNFDWIPDQDHGSVAMIALQSMLLQSEGRRITLLPAWPADWNVDFKLHAPQGTTVEGSVRAGKVERLEVTPAARRGDVVVGEPQ